MTAKRFTLFEDLDIKDKATGKIYPPCLDKGLSELIDLLNQLNDENEQLKCGNKNLKAILNDFINILNRLQSNPNDKQTLNVARDMLQNMGKELEE